MIDTSRISFLGNRGLQRIRRATVVVVGAGGGGSHLIQQLAHLAIGTIPVVDHDRLENSNVNRVVGASYDDVGRLKCDVMAKRFGTLGASIVPIRGALESIEARKWIERADLVFGAVDSFRARHNLEQLCRAALVPYIDIGLQIVCDERGYVMAIGGQIVTSLPAGPCLQCMEIITDARLAADRVEYSTGSPEQQVISMNGLLASQAMNTGLWILAGFAASFPPSVYLVYDGLRHEIKPHGFLPPTDECPHYSLEGAGWKYQLPPLQIAS